MDSQRFDALTKSIASATSRRRLLAGLAGSSLSLLGMHRTDARTCSAGGAICREAATCCSGNCVTGSDRRRRCACEIGQSACGSSCCDLGSHCEQNRCLPGAACGAGGPCTVFVTAASYQGDLGGLLGADAKCQTAANGAALTGTFKAWLSDDTSSPATRFYQSPGPYRLVNGTVIAMSWTDLTDGTLLAPIAVDQTGTVSAVPETRAWTNTLSDGTKGGVLDESCTNWTSLSDSIDGDEGQPVSVTGNWTDFASGLCSNSFRLYCFQQSA